MCGVLRLPWHCFLRSTIDSMGTFNVAVNFEVPLTALPGTTSTITFTASSLASENNVNTYITYYIVLDTVPRQSLHPPYPVALYPVEIGMICPCGRML